VMGQIFCYTAIRNTTSIRERKFAVKLRSAQFRNTSDVGIIVFSHTISTITRADTLFYCYCL
jgi:hypothetical protein